ncbi:hypothetical protein K438DRAFT_1830505 [Mycena galopus ATCC 62051]|nr:hypothetical protein K438DRAFT_1830505 [Mycena galopus ATCC 62051]
MRPNTSSNESRVILNGESGKPQQQCAYFLKGTCHFGQNCRMLHATLRVRVEPNKAPGSAETEKQECSDWKDGFCIKGQNCPYIHDTTVLAETRELRRAMLTEARRRTEEAKREHELRETLRENHRIQIAREEASKTIQHVISGSAMVSFGAGASIQHVLPGACSCRLGVSDLPFDATREEIEGLFTQQGIALGTFCVLGLAKSPDNRHLEADVVVDKEQGHLIALGLDGIEFRDETLGFDVSDNDRPDGMRASATRRSDVITFSLRAPFDSVLVSFPSEVQALEKASQLNRGMCGGRRVRVDRNRYHAGDPYFGETAVRITGLPLNCPLVTVARFAGAGLMKTLKSVDYDVQDASQLLRMHIDGIPGGRMTKYEIISGESIDGILVVKAHLGTWEHAKEVYRHFDGLRLPYTGGTSLKMHLPDPIQYTISIPLSQYRAQKRVWDSLTDAKSNSEACCIRINLQDEAFIRVLGENRKAVGALKVRVETLAAGEKVGLWHPSFASGSGESFASSVSTRAHVFARADPRLRAFKLYGDPPAIELARNLIRAEVERLSAFESTVSLKQECVGFFVRQGLKALQSALGEVNVTLDISSSPCQITVRGGVNAKDMLRRMVDASVAHLGPTAHSGIVCPVCCDEVSHPVQLNCGHSYCTGCIRHFLTTAAETKLFPLSCVGDEGQCGLLVPIPTIQRYLAPPQFQHLLDVAFNSYLEQHPQELKYCTTPDCRMVFGVTTTPTIVDCPSCFSCICSCCSADGHEGMSCEEYRIHRDPTEQDRLNDIWAQEHNVKTCPSCNVRIEKLEGCNHLACRCGAHICWKCQPVAVFEREQIYEHLNGVHGGAFDV